MELPDRIHFFSWETRVSFELPVGFEEEGEDPQTNSAIYVDEVPDSAAEDAIPARVMAKMTAVPHGQPDAYRSLAEASAKIDSRTMEDREELVIDGASAVRQVLRYRDEELNVGVLRHETFAQLENVVFSIIGLAPEGRSAEYRPAFDHAAETARFILLPAPGGDA